jgi:hypothetical protein
MGRGGYLLFEVVYKTGNATDSSRAGSGYLEAAFINVGLMVRQSLTREQYDNVELGEHGYQCDGVTIVDGWRKTASAYPAKLVSSC